MLAPSAVSRECADEYGSKCGLPISAVRKLVFSFRYCATVFDSCDRAMPLFHDPCVRGYCPVNIVDRDGMHNGFWLYARQYCTPSRASPSSTGVCAYCECGPFHAPIVSQRCMSSVMNRTRRGIVTTPLGVGVRRQCGGPQPAHC